MNKKMHSKENDKSLERDILISKILTCIIIFLVGVIGGVLLEKSMLTVKKEEKEDNNTNEKVVSIYDIEPIVKEYSTIDKSKVYLYNTNEIEIKKDNENIKLSEYLKSYKNRDDLFKSIEKELELVNSLNDGGTNIYKSKDNSMFNKDITIIKCNTTEGNKDIYIGEYMNTTTAFENGACNKKMIKDAKFTKVYTIKKIKLIQDNKYELTIYDKTNDKSVTIERVINQDSLDILKENKEYTFHFTNKYQELIKDDISTIFDEASLAGVVPLEEE